MRRLVPLALVIIITITGCTEYNKARMQSFIVSPLGNNTSISPKVASLINEDGKVISERIDVPEGFVRIATEEGSFGEYLRRLPLKPHGSPVLYFNGEIKPAEVHVAVMDIDIGDRDLQQCADAVMRLRAEYLFSKGEFERIHFNFTNGFRADFSKWMQGNRVVINGNKTTWVKKTNESTDYQSFRKYLDIVFAYAGTASLTKELNPVAIEDIQIGDIFIKGGSPGHCVIIVDMAINKETDEKLFLLAQSYMPAQEIHLLKNLNNDDGNPWYSLKDDESLDTPQWDFSIEQLMRF